jgi:uncharacterized protein YfdQ (DUF2303 family)
MSNVTTAPAYKLHENLRSNHTAESTVAADLALEIGRLQPLHKFHLPDQAKTELFFNLRTGSIDDLEHLRSEPTRHRGEQKIEDCTSFGKMVAHYKTRDKLVTFSKSALTVVAILNYPTDELPAWQDHKLTMTLRKSKELLAWEKFIAVPRGQVEFMEFLEDRLTDIQQKPGEAGASPTGPSQTFMADVVSDLSVTTDAKFAAKRELANGNFRLQNDCTHKPTVEVPREFYIVIPIFEGHETTYLIPVLLRWRVEEGKLSFILKFKNWERIFDTAWHGVRLETIEAMPKDSPWINIP